MASFFFTQFYPTLPKGLIFCIGSVSGVYQCCMHPVSVLYPLAMVPVSFLYTADDPESCPLAEKHPYRQAAAHWLEVWDLKYLRQATKKRQAPGLSFVIRNAIFA
ncbi:hypothetical protein SAMN05444371_0065 [Epilithonimonas mollis]|uniref:Uncharacterized protein n=1 Tax=Epilithonimonas mollis TaxID=216903 RepID=A0A1M6MZD4_9FLAO|nr:hypothetical protein SAMN05444371_0065 [Epilithonimonas mollis]